MNDLRRELQRVDLVPFPSLLEEVATRAASPGDRPIAVLERKRDRRRSVVVAALVLLAVVAVSWDLSTRHSERLEAGGADASWLTSSGGKCAESFSVEALRARSWAFDGTIVDVVPPASLETGTGVTLVTFQVSRWYKGGSGDTVTVKTYRGTESADASIGARILASGESGNIWGCGFSMPYTDQNAAVFTDAFGA